VLKGGKTMRHFAVVGLILTIGLLDAQAQRSIRQIDIGGAYSRSFAIAVNGHGVVVGEGSMPDLDPAVFTWTAAGGSREVLPNASPTDINNRGQIVGRIVCVECEERGFVWSASSGMRELGDFFPNAINEAGDMAGECEANKRPCAMIGGRRFVIASAGSATGINESGMVSGTRIITNIGAQRPFVWTRSGGRRELNYAPWQHGDARAINDFGQVVGVLIGNPGGIEAGNFVAVRWRQIGRIIGDPSDLTVARSVENHGWVVGTSSAPNANLPMLWRNGRVTRLPLGLNGRSGSAIDINESGVITGVVSLANGAVRATVWMVD
jgi:uncharacterized membrane protein